MGNDIPRMAEHRAGVKKGIEVEYVVVIAGVVRMAASIQ